MIWTYNPAVSREDVDLDNLEKVQRFRLEALKILQFN